MFPKQAANSLVTETLQYFVFFCRSVYYAIFAKCLIINDLRLILVILFFIAFLNFTSIRRQPSATIETSAVWAGDIVYVAASDGTVYGINKEDGKVVWKHATGAPMFGSVALSGNALVVSDFGGNVYLFCK